MDNAAVEVYKQDKDIGLERKNFFINFWYLDNIVVDINKGQENVDTAHKEVLLANEYSKKARNKL